MYCKCSRCKQLTFVRPEPLAIRIKKFGSREAMEKQWQCMKCRRELEDKSSSAPRAELPQEGSDGNTITVLDMGRVRQKLSYKL